MKTVKFQIEFLFRDAKQHTGFADFQIRDKEGINFHLNASLTALNLLRLEDREVQKAHPYRVISISSWKRRNYDEKLIDLIFFSLKNELSEKKSDYL